MLIADFDYGDEDKEHRILEDAGLEVVEAQCHTEEEVVGAGLGNTAHGGLVAMDDLLSVLEEGPLAGAALDVFPREPPPAGHPL